MKGDIFFLIAFVYHTIISANTELFGKFRFYLFGHSRARSRGLGVHELYFADTNMYENEREREREREREKGSVHVNIYAMYTCGPHRSLTGERKGQNRTGVLQLLLLMHTRAVYSAYSTRIHV